MLHLRARGFAPLTFSPDNHDALNENDYIMVRFVGNTITPVE